jgi:hypothetical protein
MSHRKGEDSPAKKRRRMPHVAVIDRNDAMRTADREELEQVCRRLTNGNEFYIGQRRQDDHDVYVVHFAEEHQAEALDRWLKEARFAARPGPPRQSVADRAAHEAAVLRWGFRTGAVRRVVQAYRREMGASLYRALGAAHKELALYRLPEGLGDPAQVFIAWAQREHWHWFFHWRKLTGLWHLEPDWAPAQDACPHSED